MDSNDIVLVKEAKRAALDVLLYNSRHGKSGLMRTAAWGYPEPYTRDLMISSLGIIASENEALIDTMKKTLVSLAEHQSPLGLIPGLANDPENLGASDTTPLFLIGLAVYRQWNGTPDFLEEAANLAFRWMEYQSPSNRVLAAQQPTSDWRDEQWVPGFGLYVNSLLYTALRLHGYNNRASLLNAAINNALSNDNGTLKHDSNKLMISKNPCFALWSYKFHGSDRIDLLGNSLAILSGIATRQKAEAIIDWIECACLSMRENEELSIDLPPNLFPFIRPEDTDWRARYQSFNRPGEYHNGGIWPFVCGFYVAALVAVGRQRLAEQKLVTLSALVRRSKKDDIEFGFNEWISPKDGLPCGEDWQAWSASMYLYAAHCVETHITSTFASVRNW